MTGDICSSCDAPAEYFGRASDAPYCAHHWWHGTDVIADGLHPLDALLFGATSGQPPQSRPEKTSRRVPPQGSR